MNAEAGERPPLNNDLLRAAANAGVMLTLAASVALLALGLSGLLGNPAAFALGQLGLAAMGSSIVACAVLVGLRQWVRAEHRRMVPLVTALSLTLAVATTVLGLAWLLEFNAGSLSWWALAMTMAALSGAGVTALAATPVVSICYAAPLLALLLTGALQSGRPDFIWPLLATLIVVVIGSLSIRGRAVRLLDISVRNTALADELQATNTRHEALNRELRDEIEQRRQAQAEVQQAQLAAESANMAKGEFLATMSHEIRTPLNGILPILDILRSTNLDVEQKEYVNTAFQSSKALLRIIDDILDYSKIDAGKLELESVGLNLKELIDNVIRLMSKSAEQKNLNLRAQIDPDVRLAARGDPTRLRQVLTNLVSNAIKFTRRGQVLISVRKRGETRTHSELLFAVKDTGVGMDEDTSSKLFKPFTQADASTTRLHGGTGLGLAICRQLVELMDGEIGVKSELGKGSVFWFTVKLEKAAGDVGSRRRSLQGSRVIVASPDTNYAAAMGARLEGAGMQVKISHSAADAINQLRADAKMGRNWAQEFAVVDAQGLGERAPALLNAILAEPQLKDLAVLVLTAKGTSLIDLPPREDRLVYAANDAGAADLVSAIGKLAGVEGSNERIKSIRELAMEVGGEPTDRGGKSEDAPIRGHCLLVEDNPVNLHVAQRLLKLIGVSFEVARNGQEALDRLQSNDYHAILMDCQMPVLDGYRATGRIRQGEAESDDKPNVIIAMTANAMAGDREKCLNAGMDDYMSKPLNRAVLEEMLRKWLPDGAHTQGAPTAPPSAAKPQAAPVVAPPASLPSAAQAGLASANTTAIDQQVFGELLEVMGDDLDELIEVYLEDSPKALATLQQAAARDDIEGLIPPAHSLKSTSGNLGAVKVSNIARDIEYGARMESLADAQAMVDALQREYVQAAAGLQSLRPAG